MTTLLRKIRENDLEMLMNWRMNPSVTANLYTDPKLTMELQYKWYEKICNDSNSRYWIIEFDQTPIGLIWLYSIDRTNSRCEWGYFIGDDSFRGKGIARALECNMYDYVFDTLKLHKLYFEVFTFNEKVISIHQKFGAEIEGTLKEHIFKNGKFYDIVTMAILSDKWHSIKHEYEYEKIFIEE